MKVSQMASVVFMVLTLLAVPRPASAQAVQPADLLVTFEEAFNRGDVEAVVAVVFARCDCLFVGAERTARRRGGRSNLGSKR